MNAASAIVTPRPPAIPQFIWFVIGVAYGIGIGVTAAIAYCRRYGC